MVRGWFTVRVELVSGGGMVLDPRPGRILLVGPEQTFKGLAVAIDLAFARWDLSHLHEFEFPDGRRYGIPDEEFGQEATDYEVVQIRKCVCKGDRFAYVFDFGDNWQHRCQVAAADSNLGLGLDS